MKVSKIINSRINKQTKRGNVGKFQKPRIKEKKILKAFTKKCVNGIFVSLTSHFPSVAPSAEMRRSSSFHFLRENNVEFQSDSIKFSFQNGGKNTHSLPQTLP